ncbi:MAG TPA: alpha/beta hydrolase [Chloroflexota bacterium]
MESAKLDGITLEYEASGTGEPVVFIHGAFIADSFRPLMSEPSLADHYELILYHRRGYAGSSRASGRVSPAQQAEDCSRLLWHLGVERVHVVGHSWGGCFALQLALDFPELVHSLAVLEAGLMTGASGRAYRESLIRVEQRFHEVGPATVADSFLKARWPGYRPHLDRILPGAFERAVADAGTTFGPDLGLLDWTFGEAEAGRITQPTLVVLGGDSESLDPRFPETRRLLLQWLPNAEDFVLPGKTHFMQVEKPREMAEALSRFFARYPASV